MLKYDEIIKKLSDSEKIRLLCDVSCLSDKHYRALGIPELNITALEDYCAKDYPALSALANTWDTELVGKVADDLFRRAAETRVGLVKIPAPRIKVNPYRQAATEDPALASAMSGAYLAAAERAGIAVGMSGFGLYKDDPEWLDKSPDERFIREMLVKPYQDAVNGRKCAAILTKEDLASDAYGEVNSKLKDLVSQDGIASDITPVCANVSAENTVLYLINGGICFEGSVLAVESALSRYKKLSEDIAHGYATMEELQAEIADGKAISPEMLDCAVDRMLNFIFSVKRKPNLNTIGTEQDLDRKVAQRTTVLLKNERNILPLKKTAKIGLIGDIGLCPDEQGESLLSGLQAHLTKDGFHCAGIERGYDFCKERSESLIDDAVNLAKKCDVVLLFLGTPETKIQKSHKTKQLCIPANQLELLDRLGDVRNKIVAILPCEQTEDICIPEHCAAMMLAPLKVKCSAEVLAEILQGKKSPEGRLANTVYHQTDRCYAKHKTYHEQEGLRTGGLIGYRYYDMTDDLSGFPFGHGLGYGEIAYSSLSVSGDKVKVVLQNNGKLAVVEVVQVYVGKNHSALIRPKKELCGFACVELKPGERKAVEIPICIPQVYDVATAGFVTENGSYSVYVGASVCDIRLTANLNLKGDEPEPDHQNPSDYYHSVTNILSDNYKLEAKIKAMKKSVFNFVAGGIALVLALVLKLFCVTQNLDFAFFDFFAIALALTGIAFFVVEAIRRSRIKNEQQHAVDKLNAEAFEEADLLPVYDAEKMFVEEFDTAEAEAEAASNEQIEGVDSEYLQYIDKEQSFERAAADFELYAAQRGCKFRADVTKKIFASLASSRLLVVEGMSDAELMTFTKVLSGYFDTGLFIDQVDNQYHENESVLFKTDFQGYKTKTNVHLALDAARNARFKVHLAVLSHVKCDALYTYFTPYVNYVKNPTANNNIVVLNDRNLETSFYIPQNVWFVLSLDKGEKADRLPEFVSEVATVNRFDFDNYSVSEQPTKVRNFSYYQMDYLADRAASKLSVDEETWKRIDHLEEYVASVVPFHIGNKLWLCMEKYSYVYLACGGDKTASVDEAIAAKLMVPIISKLGANLKAEERSLGETVESILGEDRAEACKKVIRACTDSKA